MTSFCSACKLKQNQFVTETYINNNSANTIWFLFDYPYNFHSFLKHYTAQLKTSIFWLVMVLTVKVMLKMRN